MLNSDALSQLKQLKQEIEDQKEFAEGVVKGTQQKFGFVILDDGREIFLPPEEMDKLFPGDRIRVQIFTSNKKKPRAQIERLLNSPLQGFCGRYIVKGKGHFVAPDLPRLSRWIFIPPSARKGASNGDYIQCQISRHPYPEAKPQAKVLAVIGSPAQAGIEAAYMISKFELEQAWPEDWQQSLLDPDDNERQDLTALDFVTIDASSTRDMDDALYAEATSEGWQLSVAIADPCALIAAGSPLEREARRRGTSTYFPGRVVPMLPEELANQRCSLLAGESRPVLVCQMAVATDGKISGYRITEATIRSRAQLSYSQVAQLIDGGDTSADYAAMVNTLAELASAMRQHRDSHHIIVKDRPEFRLILNAQGKIERIEPQLKTSAHPLVEECMVAANRCAADMLGQQGLFNCHRGFRPERLRDASKLAEEQLQLSELDLSTPQAYQQVMKAAASLKDAELPVQSVLSRLLERGRLSAELAPHFGMGLAGYTSFTSPIRRFADFIVHRLIKALLKQQDPDYPSQQQLDELQLNLDKSRQARQQMEQWLKCQYLQNQLGNKASGVISQINSRGFTVRLDDNGIEGFVETRSLGKKFSFDPMRLKLNSDDASLQLDMPVKVVIKEVDCAQRSIHFTLDTEPAA